MSVTLESTGIRFPDASLQTTAATAGGVSSFNTRTGAVTLSSSDVTGALGFTPGDITGVTAGDGLTGGATSGTATLAVGAGTGISVSSTAVSVTSPTLRNVSSGYTSGGQVFITGTAPTASAAGDIWLDTTGLDGYTQALSTSGYTKLPNGFMMVWATSTSIGQDSSVTQTFPYSFPTACLHVFLTGQGAINTGGGGSDVTDSKSKTGFILRHGSDPARSFSYIAIGY